LKLAWRLKLSFSFFIYILVFAIAHGLNVSRPAGSTAAALVALLRGRAAGVVA